MNRSKGYLGQAKNFGGQVNNFNQKLAGQGGQGQNAQQGAQQGAQQMQQGYGQPPGQPGGAPGYPQQGQGGYPQQGGGGGMPQGAPGMPGMPPGMPGMPQQGPAIRTTGWWIFKKKFCTQCEQQLDKTWDACPYCVQIAQQAAAAPQKLQAMKTQALIVDQSGAAGSTQLLGWLVPLQGPQKGELFTLSPVTVIGIDPKCNICLQDKFMSSRHAEIKAENGMWVLRDSGSTNGTYVNNRRVDRHELVDNDFVKFGNALLKFKSL
ncbi:MAG TPA: FHA domain-containing protein [Kofleriaceae bacterium]